MFFSADVTVHLIFWKFIIVEEDWLHFPRSFLLNYRPALQNPSNDVVLSHLHS